MLGGPPTDSCPLLMDGAYEGNETRALSRDLGFVPVVPPSPNRLEPWEYDKELYKKRNEIELDVIYLGFLTLALIVEALR